MTERRYIDGVDQRSVHNPYDNTEIAAFGVASAARATAAVDATERALITRAPARRRAAILDGAGATVLRRQGEFATTVEQRLREAA